VKAQAGTLNQKEDPLLERAQIQMMQECFAQKSHSQNSRSHDLLSLGERAGNLLGDQAKT